MNSLRNRFITSMLLLLAGLALLLFYDANTNKELKSAQAHILKIKEAKIALLQMRRAEKDFFVRQHLKYYDLLLQIAKDSKKDFLDFDLALEYTGYISNFKKIAHHMKVLGLVPEEGLKKDFSLHSHRLEQDLTEDKHIKMLLQYLSLKMHEKDFFIHKKIKYIDLRTHALQNMKDNKHLSINTSMLLENENKAFIALKTEMLRIGLNEKLGLRIQMRDAAHQIEDALNTYTSTSLPLLEEKIQKLNFTRYSTFSLFLLSVLLLFTLTLRPIYFAFKSFKEFFTHFSDAKQRLDIENLKFIELKNTAKTINTMLQSRQDIEDNLIKSKDEAIRSQQVKEQFLTNMSHELRTPLNAIIGFTSILEKKIPEHAKIIEPISVNSKNLLEIINNILDISKIQSGHFSINKEAFHCAKEFETCLSKFSFSEKKKNIQLTSSSNITEECVLHGDWFRISQVLTNFLSNAFKFTPDNGTIALRMELIDKQLHISVKDSGIGISEEAQERILKPFEQADSSTTKNFGGTGLGLSISNSIITMMGGTINIVSKEGQGSEFSFSIPIDIVEKTAQILSADIPDTQEELQISAHILVVEDNKTNQMLLTMLLDDVGITFDVANDGLEAVEMYEDNKYDIVLMDENMPNMNGVDAMQKIKKDYVNVCPIVAVTANVMKGDELRLIDAGMDAFVAKPIDDDELFATIRKLLKPSQA
ncbi:MAG: ATP-binding protein [Sulfurimonas sp.]|nr:ATP-binding protein [Sulfurimonas sp.]MDQ7060355.1 ATP-binding protein [Sulfurimonas sp.]